MASATLDATAKFVPPAPGVAPSGNWLPGSTSGVPASCTAVMTGPAWKAS